MSLPLVLLHGFTGSPRSWDGVVRALGEGHEISTPVLSGHTGLGFANVESFDDELRRLLTMLREGSTLVGYSLGARVALGLLTLAPERFRAALLIGVHPGLRSEAERAERRDADARRARLLRERGLAAFLEEWERQPLFATQAELPADALDAQAAIRRSHDAEGLARSLEVMGLGSMPERWTSLSRIELPVTLAAGECDPKFSELGRLAAAELPRSRLLLAPSAGHNLPLERPEWVARTILTLPEPG